MSTYQSVQSNTSASSTTVVVTKPTGLAVGDWLVAGVYAHRDSGADITLSTPSGWTSQQTWVFSSGTARFALFTKIADSADVAASNFTFTSPTLSSGHMIAHVARVTSAAFSSGSTVSAVSSSAPTFTAPTFTPTRINTLFLGFIGAFDTSIPTTGTPSLATNNPTWTQQASSTVDDGSFDSRLSFFTATRAEATATGTITGTASGTRGAFVSVISLAPVVNGSVSQETKLNAYALSPIPKTELNAVVEDPTTNSQFSPTWKNPDKPSSTWANKPK